MPLKALVAGSMVAGLVALLAPPAHAAPAVRPGASGVPAAFLGLEATGLPVEAQFGDAVGSADVNGDGRDDAIVAAPGATVRQRNGAGAVYVLFGSAATTPVDVGALGSRGFRIDGEEAFVRLGIDVSGAGDVNGDGFEDVLIGQAFGPEIPGRSGQGRAWIVFGSADPTDVDLASPGTRAVLIEGAADFDQAGASVAGIGDVTGDLRDDVLIGAPGNFPGNQTLNGAAYVIAGSGSLPTAPGKIDLAVANDYSYRITGGSQFGDFGSSSAGLGDVNGDGRADFVVGAPFAGSGGETGPRGEAWVIFGSAGPQSDVDLANPEQAGVRAYRIEGGDGDRAGFDVAGPGDVTGDGRPDVLVGAPRAFGGETIGYASLVSGNQTAGAVVNAREPGGGGSHVINGPKVGSRAGSAVGGAGDQNGDGRPDLIIGDPLEDTPGGTDAGAAWVVYGAARTAPVSLASLGDQGFRIEGTADREELGRAVDGIGDFNGDGREDLGVGAPGAVQGGDRRRAPQRTTSAAYLVTGGVVSVGIAPASLDFGGRRVDLGATPAQTVTVTATGTTGVASIPAAGITVSGAEGDFAVSGGDCAGALLAPGQSCTVSLTFDPSATGARTATLAVGSDAAPSPLTVALTGEGQPAPVPAATPTPAPTPVPPDLVLICSGRPIVLLDVLPAGRGRIRLTGQARQEFAGQQVTIRATVRRAPGGTATVKPDGTFEARLRAPSDAAYRKVRYVASIGTNTSRALRLYRELVIEKVTKTATATTITARLVRAQRGGAVPVTISRQYGCGDLQVFRTVRLNRQRRFTVSLPAPVAPETVAYYRATTKLGQAGKTYTLPIIVRR